MIDNLIPCNTGPESLAILNDLIDEHNTIANEQKQVIYWASISSDVGTISIPTGATIILDQFQAGADAFVSTIQNGQPSGVFPQTIAGFNVDVSTFDALGNYTLDGVPSAYPVGLIFVLQISELEFGNLDLTKVVETYSQPNLEEKIGYSLQFATGSTFNPVDASQLYFGMNYGAAAGAAGGKKIPIVKSGTITEVGFQVWVNGTIATSETSSLYIIVYDLNGPVIGGTATLISSAITWNSANRQNQFQITNLNIAILAGQWFELRIDNPTWVTNPTACWLQGCVNIKSS